MTSGEIKRVADTGWDGERVPLLDYLKFLTESSDEAKSNGKAERFLNDEGSLGKVAPQ